MNAGNVFVRTLRNFKGVYANDIHVLKTYFRRPSNIRDIEESWQNAPSDLVGQEFQNWFDTAPSDELTEMQSEIDFYQRILKDLVLNDTKVSCEIGFGGGRLLRHAANNFDLACGIDVHDNFSGTKRYLKEKKYK